MIVEVFSMMSAETKILAAGNWRYLNEFSIFLSEFFSLVFLESRQIDFLPVRKCRPDIRRDMAVANLHLFSVSEKNSWCAVMTITSSISLRSLRIFIECLRLVLAKRLMYFLLWFDTN